MKPIQIQHYQIGQGHPCFIIAEIGSNYVISTNKHTNYQHALTLIDLIAQAGADAVKFQLFRANTLYTKQSGTADYLGKPASIYDIIKTNELPYHWLPKLKKYCEQKGLIFLCTPFDTTAVDELEKIHIDAYKIASTTITHLSLLQYIAEQNKPILLSTGASTIHDIGVAIDTITNTGNNQLSLLQCTVKYPTPLSAVHLRVIPKLQETFDISIGFSDHSREPIIAPLGAVALGACILEKHVTTDNNLSGPDHKFAIIPNELRTLVTSIRQLESALGTHQKHVQPIEHDLYQFARHCIFAKTPIARGDVFTIKNIGILRGGTKRRILEPYQIQEVLGVQANHDYKEGEPIEQTQKEQ